MIDFSEFDRGSQVVLQGSIFGLPVDVLRFDVTRRVARHDRLPTKPTEVERLREFVFAFDPAAGKMLSNGKEFDPNNSA